MKNRKESMEHNQIDEWKWPSIEEGWNQTFPTYKFVYQIGGKNMLSEKYKKTKLTENEKLAYDLGATNEDGILTEKGINLLATILLEEKDIADKFYKALKKIDEEDE